MLNLSLIQFVIEEAEEGGYTARAIGLPIYTEGDTMDEVVHNIREASECHFLSEKQPVPPIIANLIVPQFA